jgi:6-phosphogluconolactonase
MTMEAAARAALEILPDSDALARRVADWMTDIARSKDGPVGIALSGGSTPKRLYELLATEPWRTTFPWARSHWFWGDERFTPPGDPRSNYGMAREALLSHVPIPAGAIHAVPTTGMTPAQAAEAYGRELAAFYGAAVLDPTRPLFDVTLLGLGEDGHTASLFPGSAALGEQGRWVAAVVGAAGDPRITLTFPVLESSNHIAFLVEGQAKRDILGRLLRGDGGFPAARIRTHDELCVFADRAAVGDRAQSP